MLVRHGYKFPYQPLPSDHDLWSRVVFPPPPFRNSACLHGILFQFNMILFYIEFLMVGRLQSNLGKFYLPQSHLSLWRDSHTPSFHLPFVTVLLLKGIKRLCPSLCRIPIILDRFITSDRGTENGFSKASAAQSASEHLLNILSC